MVFIDALLRERNNNEQFFCIYGSNEVDKALESYEIGQ